VYPDFYCVASISSRLTLSLRRNVPFPTPVSVATSSTREICTSCSLPVSATLDVRVLTLAVRVLALVVQALDVTTRDMGIASHVFDIKDLYIYRKLPMTVSAGAIAHSATTTRHVEAKQYVEVIRKAWEGLQRAALIVSAIFKAV
jgi:hypothetical protein